MKIKLILLVGMLYTASPFCTFAQVAGTIVDSIRTKQPGFNMGITYDGSGLWVTSSLAKYIQKYSLTGVLIDSIPDPARALSDRSQGIVYAGGFLWTTNYSSDSLYKINTATKTVVGKYKGCNTDDRPSIAYDGMDTLYIPNGSDEAGATKFSLSSQTFVPWGDGTGAFARGMYYRNGNIYSTLRAYDVIAMKLKTFIFELDKASGVSSNKKEWCMNRGSFGGLGMTFDGTYIWQTTELTNRWVYKILWNPTTSTKSDLQNHPFIVRVSEDKNSLFINDVSKKTGYLALFDFYGREIRYVQAEDGSTLDITTLPPGAYMVQAYSLKREQLARQKFLK